MTLPSEDNCPLKEERMRMLAESAVKQQELLPPSLPLIQISCQASGAHLKVAHSGHIAQLDSTVHSLLCPVLPSAVSVPR